MQTRSAACNGILECLGWTFEHGRSACFFNSHGGTAGLSVVHLFVVDQGAAWVDCRPRRISIVLLCLRQGDRGDLLRVLYLYRKAVCFGARLRECTQTTNNQQQIGRIPT